MEPILVIMAAGMGSRYGGNKQIDPISEQGDIIMDFSLFDAYRAGFRRVVFVIKKDFETVFREHIDNRAGKVFETHYVYQELTDIPEGFDVPKERQKPWGTAHAVLSARDVIDAPFAVINADDYYGVEAFEKIYQYLSKHADASHHCMVGFRLSNTLSENGTVARGVCDVEDGYLKNVEEHLEIGRDAEGIISGQNVRGERVLLSEDTTVSMNLWGFGAEFIGVMQEMFATELQLILVENPLKGEFYLPKCIDQEVKSGEAEVCVLKSFDRWFGVTYREDKPDVVAQFEKMRAQGIYPQNLWK